MTAHTLGDNMNKLFTIASFVILSTSQAYAQLSIDGTLTSDYVFRGISASDEEAALQINFNYGFSSGAYAGVWASTLSETDDQEVDYFVGYNNKINDELSYDVNYTFYSYHGLGLAQSIDYGELIFNVTYNDMINFVLGYANDFGNADETGIYVAVGGSHSFNESTALNVGVGSYSFDETTEDYIHYHVGVSKSFEKISLDLTYHDTDIDNSDIADGRLVLSVNLSIL